MKKFQVPARSFRADLVKLFERILQEVYISAAYGGCGRTKLLLMDQGSIQDNATLHGPSGWYSKMKITSSMSLL